MSTNNEIKKELYKQNPLAYLLGVTKDSIDYKAELDGENVFFNIPINDIGDATFYYAMPAKHLIRYINIVTKKQ
jgi:hypothetical protein